jgi:hypothetical protein
MEQNLKWGVGVGGVKFNVYVLNMKYYFTLHNTNSFGKFKNSGELTLAIL